MRRKKQSDDAKITMEDGREVVAEAGEHLGSNAPVAAEHGLAAMALSMALKYHDISTVQDGTLYQQYKLEGKNFQELHLDMVFETAMRIEMHLISAPSRLAGMIADNFANAAIHVLEVALNAESDDPAESGGAVSAGSLPPDEQS